MGRIKDQKNVAFADLMKLKLPSADPNTVTRNEKRIVRLDYMEDGSVTVTFHDGEVVDISV